MESSGGSVVYRYAGKPLTGINDIKGTAPCAEAVVCCSGLSLQRYDDSIAPSLWPRVAVNEAIRKLRSATWWVLADDPILYEYADVAPPGVKILAMQQATSIVGRFAKGRRYWTVESMSKIGAYGNGYQFFSRGTVLIGAIEMLRFMGHTRFFVFGCDCSRTKAAYYYDGRTPIPLSEKHFVDNQRVRGLEGEKLYVTPRLKNMIERLNAVKASGLWDGIEVWCVDSPLSQQNAMPKLSIEDFKEIASESQESITQPLRSLAEAARAATDVLARTESRIEKEEDSPTVSAGGEAGAPSEAAPAACVAPPPKASRHRRRTIEGMIPRGLATPDTPPEKILPTQVPPGYRPEPEVVDDPESPEEPEGAEEP